jgi:RNA polymerase sigma factor (sigma-70 family)
VSVFGRRRETEDFDAAYRELLPRAKRVAYRILGDITDAEDAAVEALARASLRWRKLADLPRGQQDAWVLRVTANVAYDEVRRRIRRQQVPPAAALAERQEASDLVEDRELLVKELAGLPRRQREVLTLRYIGGLSESEIAQSLGVSAGTVKTSASRGLVRLRAAIGVDWWHDDALG